MQTLVQQEAGVLLDRQRITIEGIPTPNPNHADALHPLARFCMFVYVALVHSFAHHCYYTINALHVNGFQIIQHAPPEHVAKLGVIMRRLALPSLQLQG